MSRPKKILLSLIKRYIKIISVTFIAGGILGFLYFYLFKDLPDPRGLKNYKVIPVSSRIFDRNGELLFEVYRKENRTPVKFSKLPPYIKQATLAIEDKDFYKHGGISVIGGIARALKDVFILHTGLQGGSTITQQLVKSALLSPERTVRRKLREIILAMWVEEILTKDEILELYLNQVPYGGLSYGVEQASLTYFGKSAKDITLGEAALLAGLPQAPSLYSPFANPAAAKKRRNEVLKRMEEDKYINHSTRLKEQKKEISIIPFRTKIRAPHFVFYIKSILEQEYGAATVEEGGLKIYTTLDYKLQHQAESIVAEELDKVKRLRVGNGAVLVTRPPTGEILAMVGSADYFASPSGTFNVTTALRQPGSSIKPINYAIGIERKLVTPATVFLDTQTCFTYAGGVQKYCPKNYDGQFHGAVQLRAALANSYNIPAVKMMAMNGVREFVASSSSFLITTFKDPSRYGLSLTLGGGEVRMTEMAQAFSAFANEGVPKKLVSVLRVEDKNGKLLYEYKDSNFKKDIRESLSYPNYLAVSGKRALSQETAFLISHILLDNNARSAAFGSSSFLNIPGKTASVKTGTTNDKRDNWTIGYTPNFLVTVWVGNNDNSPMHPSLSSGVTGAAPIWNRVMKSLLESQPNLLPRKPDGVVGRQVCLDTGSMMSRSPEGAESCASRFEYFIKGTDGIKPATSVVREVVPVSRDSGKQTTQQDPSHEMQEKTVLKDSFSSYCLDCAHDPAPTP